MSSKANIIVVGGPISVGKSTLVASLGIPQVPELDASDELQALLLEMLYGARERMANETIELYFLQNRIHNYKLHATSSQRHVLDRSILESLWFARGTLSTKSFQHFETFWAHEVQELFAHYGKPLLYILLTMNWTTFAQRLFHRGRAIETTNFTNNEQYFRKHIAEYEDWMTGIFRRFGINYIKIKTDNMTANDVLTAAKREIIKLP